MSKPRSIRLRKGVTIARREGGIWHLTLVQNKERLRRSLETSDEKLARAMALEWAERLLGLGAPRFQTFETFARDWLDRQALRLRPSTIAGYSTSIREACRKLGNRPLASITRADAVRLARSMQINSHGRQRSRATLRNLFAGLHSLYEEARHLELASENPFGSIGRLLRDVAPVPSVADEADDSAIPYTREEQERLLDAITDAQDHTAVLLAIRSGLRRSEVLALRWGDLDLNGRYVHVRRRLSRGAVGAPKTTASRRTVPLSEGIVRTLRSLRVGQKKHALAVGDEVPAAVFPARKRRTAATEFQQERRFSDRFMMALGRAKIERRTTNPFHRLRHTFASELLTNGVPIFKVSKWLGHSSIQLTSDTYGHLVPRPDEHEALDQLDGEAALPRSAPKMPQRRGASPGKVS